MYLADYLARLGGAHRRARRDDGGGAASLQCVRALGRAGGDAFHAHGYGASVLSRRAKTSEFIWGRGACDTKGIIASMIKAVEALLADGDSNFGLLFVVGEERNSAGAYFAAKHPRGSRYIINGEPTENKLALGSKGALRYEIVAQREDGAFGVSATGRIGDRETAGRAGARSGAIQLPPDPILGASTLNIGTIHGRPRAERDSGSRAWRRFLFGWWTMAIRRARRSPKR